MLTGYFSGVSGSYYNEQKLNIVSNNLANVQTSGFRRSLMMLRSREENPYTRNIDRDVRKRMPTTYGVERLGVFHDYEKAGALRQTDNPFDIAIPTEIKNGFFMVRRVGAAADQVRYTRNGQLSLGQLNPENPNSPTVLYLSGHLALDENKQPISIDPSDGPVHITGDGTIYQGESTIGQIPVYRLNKSSDPSIQSSANLQALLQEGDSLFKVPEKSKGEFHPNRIEVGQAGIERVVAQGMREGSNVNIYHELMEMMNATKGFTANQRSLKQQLDSATKLFEMVRR